MSTPAHDFSSLEGRCVLITGGAGVLAKSFAQAFLSLGAHVALLDLFAQQAEAAADELSSARGGTCLGFGGNALDAASLEAAKLAIEAKLGPVDVLINAAGGNAPAATTTQEQLDPAVGMEGSFFDLSMDAFDASMRLNLSGTVLPSQIFGRGMSERQSGTILNISSMNAYKPLTRIPAYAAAKCAVSNFTEWLAVHLAPTGVRVNAIAPGFFLTEQLRFLAFDKEGKLTPRYEKVLAKIAMHRLGDPAELNGAVLFLCSDLAQYITGITLPIDGGFNASSGV